jgi:hypothetical protein
VAPGRRGGRRRLRPLRRFPGFTINGRGTYAITGEIYSYGLGDYRRDSDHQDAWVEVQCCELTIRVEHIRRVVAGVVARALTRLAVALVSGRGRICVEAAHLVVAPGEGDVDVLGGLARDHEQGAALYSDSEGDAVGGS